MIVDNFIKSDDLNWLMLAAHECNHTKRWQECLHVIDGKGYTTDGHRMHVAPVPLMDGIYDAFTDGLNIMIGGQVNMPNSLDLKARFDGWYSGIIGHGKTVLLSDMVSTMGFNGRVDTECGTAGAQRKYVIQALFGMDKGEDTVMNFGLLHGGENMLCGTDGQRSFAVIGLRLDKESDCEG